MPKAAIRRKRSSAVLRSSAPSVEVRALIAALHSDDGTVRRSAREALVAIGNPAVRSLIETLRDVNEHLRWEAAKALGEIRDKTAAAALVVALEDESSGIRWLAAEGLIALGQPTLPQLLPALVRRADSIWLREGALHVLHLLAHQGLADETRPVVAALEGPEPTVAVPFAAGDAIEQLAERGSTAPRRSRRPLRRKA